MPMSTESLSKLSQGLVSFVNAEQLMEDTFAFEQPALERSNSDFNALAIRQKLIRLGDDCDDHDDHDNNKDVEMNMDMDMDKNAGADMARFGGIQSYDTDTQFLAVQKPPSVTYGQTSNKTAEHTAWKSAQIGTGGYMWCADVWSRFEERFQGFQEVYGDEFTAAETQQQSPFTGRMQQQVSVPVADMQMHPSALCLPKEVKDIMDSLAKGPCKLSNNELDVAYKYWDVISAEGNVANLLNVYMRGGGKEKSENIALECMFVIKVIVAEWGLDLAAVLKRFICSDWPICLCKTQTKNVRCNGPRMFGSTNCSRHKQISEVSIQTFVRSEV